MAMVLNASEGANRAKNGYARPSLSVGLEDDGATIGTRDAAPTCAATDLGLKVRLCSDTSDLIAS